MANEPDPANPPAPAPPAPVVTDPAEGYKKLMEKYNNDALKVVEVLYGDNHKLREKNRELSSKVPAEGAVILAGDDVKAFEALKALGKTPEEIRQALYEHGEFTADRARRETEAKHHEFAEVAGFNPKVLSKLLDDSDIEVEVQEPPGPQGGPQKGRDGKTLRVAMVKLEDPKDKRKSLFVPLADYAAKHWAEFLPALKANGTTVARPNGTPPARESPMPPAPPVAGGIHGRKNPF